MNTESFDGVKCLNMEGCKAYGNGAFCFTNDLTMIGFVLPGGGFEYITIYKEGDSKPNTNRAVWVWDGNVDKPTLKPSLHRVGRWHGHLTNGIFKSC